MPDALKLPYWQQALRVTQTVTLDPCGLVALYLRWPYGGTPRGWVEVRP